MINRKSKRVISGLLAAVTFLSALIQPAAVIVGEPEPAAYEAEYPALEINPDSETDTPESMTEAEMEAVIEDMEAAA